MICVVQPPPSAKWGKTDAAVPGGEPRSMTGNVVQRRSDRSFRSPRSATTATDFDALNVNVPENAGGPLKRTSLRKPAIWPFAGTVVAPEDTVCPLSSTNLNDKTAGSLFGFAIAMPLRTPALVSAYIRPCVNSFDAGTAASETRTPFWRKLKIARPDGSAPDEPVGRAQPT